MTMNKTPIRLGNVVANRPNWNATVREEFEYLTSIIEARDGTEKRDSLRQTPRMTVQYSSDHFGTAGQRLFADLNRFEDTGLWVVPVRWRNVRLALIAELGDSVIQIDRDPPIWLKAGTILVFENEQVQEAMVVDSVVGRDITLTEALQTTFTQADLVMLGHSARYDTANTLTSLVSTHRSTVSRFEVDPGSSPEWDINLARAPIHEGYRVFVRKPNWATRLSVTANDQRETLDPSRGVVDVSRYRKSSRYDLQMEFMGFEQADVDEMIGHFMHNMGRRGMFWLPSQMRDMEIVEDVVAGADSFKLPGSDFHRAFAEDDAVTTVMARYPDGCLQLNRIKSATTDNGDTVLTFVDPWDRAVTRDMRLSFAFLVRYRDDRLVVNWATARTATMTIGFRPLANDFIPTNFITRDVSPWPIWYYNTATDPIVNPERFLKLDLAALGVPVAALDRGFVNFAHEMFAEGDGPIPLVTVTGRLYYYGGSDTEIAVSRSVEEFQIDGDSRQPITGGGEETETTARYTKSKRLPPERDYARAGQPAFNFPIRVIYLRGNVEIHPIFGSLSQLTRRVTISWPEWGPWEQEGNTFCP